MLWVGRHYPTNISGAELIRLIFYCEHLAVHFVPSCKLQTVRSLGVSNLVVNFPFFHRLDQSRSHAPQPGIAILLVQYERTKLLSQIHLDQRLHCTPCTVSIYAYQPKSSINTDLMKVKIKSANLVATWHWDLPVDEVCGICRVQFDGTCPTCRFPGDDCSLLMGKCGHSFHMHCLMTWIGQESSRGLCPMCRQKFEWRDGQEGEHQQRNSERVESTGNGDAMP